MNRQSEKDPRRQLQGYTSKKKGQAFEAIIAAACRAYRVERTAYIDKTPEPMRVIGRGQKGQFTAIFEKKAQPDFKGTLSGGRAVCFEAKNKEGDRVNQTAVTQEQKEALNDHADLGAVTFVLLCMNRMDYYRVPWRIWRSMKRHYGRMYMTLEELEPFRIRFDNTLKFLEGIHETGL